MRTLVIVVLVLAWTQIAKAEIVAHPHGCPARNFCGCGLSVHFFGKSIRDLWLARNWLRFPRAMAADGMAAVKHGGHHVFGLLRHIAGDTWMVYDPNSGHHRTRIHPRSIRGYTIVNPHGRKWK